MTGSPSESRTGGDTFNLGRRPQHTTQATLVHAPPRHIVIDPLPRHTARPPARIRLGDRDRAAPAGAVFAGIGFIGPGRARG